VVVVQAVATGKLAIDELRLAALALATVLHLADEVPIEVGRSLELLTDGWLVDETTLLPAKELAIGGGNSSRVCGCKIVDSGECCELVLIVQLEVLEMINDDLMMVCCCCCCLDCDVALSCCLVRDEPDLATVGVNETEVDVLVVPTIRGRINGGVW